MAYYGGGAHALRQALMLGGRPGIVPPIQMPQQRPQQAPAQMRQPAVSYPSRPGAPPQVAQGRMTPQQLQALGRGGTAQYRYPNEGIQREPNQPNRYMTGTQKFMSQMLGAQPKTGADLDRLDAAKRMGLVGAGISLLSNIGGVQRPDLPGNPGSFGRNLADALSTGIGMSRGTFAASAPAAPEFISGPGGGVYRYDSETDALTEAVPGVAPTDSRPSEIQLYEYALRLPEAQRAAFSQMAFKTDSPLEEFQAYQKLGPEAKEAYLEFTRAKGTNNNFITGPGEFSVGNEGLQAFVNSGFNAVPELKTSLYRIGQAESIAARPEFAEVSGPAQTLKDAWAQWAGTEAGVISAEFDQLTAQEGMAELQGFTGPKTEAEQRIAWQMGMADRGMTQDQIMAGLAIRRRMKIFEQADWAEMILSYGDDPSIFGSPQAYAAYKSRAEEVMDLYVTELKTLAADPFTRSQLTPEQLELALPNPFGN